MFISIYYNIFCKIIAYIRIDIMKKYIKSKWNIVIN